MRMIQKRHRYRVRYVVFAFSTPLLLLLRRWGETRLLWRGSRCCPRLTPFANPKTECVRLYDTTYRIFLTVPTVFRFCVADGPEENDPGPTKIWNMTDLSSWLVSVCQRYILWPL